MSVSRAPGKPEVNSIFASGHRETTFTGESAAVHVARQHDVAEQEIDLSLEREQLQRTLCVVDLNHLKAESAQLLHHDLPQLGVVFDHKDRLVGIGVGLQRRRLDILGRIACVAGRR